MTTAQQRARIRQAYSDCLQLSRKHQSGWVNYLEQAFEAAQQGERQHRRGPGVWRMSVIDAARWFAVRWFLDTQKAPKSWRDACAIRDDARFGLAARDCCPKPEVAKLRKTYADVLGYDYSEWVSR